ncbi:MAG TPA: sigma-70 family RNA polymerase sigma factor [Methylomirabilota bacterium]|nr:sigma-70 family RNA polymerase sigma factor [Methylomirabilota bacterium]
MSSLGPYSPEKAGQFRTTHWSVVLQAVGPSAESESALQKLCSQYWHPVYTFIRCRGYSPDQAKDLTQEFFARLLAGDSLQTANPERRRFRSFLLGAVKHLLASEWRDANRLKRGGGQEIISWDGIEAEERELVEPGAGMDAELLFDRRWAQRIVSASIARLEAEARRDGLEERFAELKKFLQGDGQAGSYQAAAAKLGLSEPAVKSAIFRMRRRYGEILREEIGETVASPGEVESEIRHLIAVLAAG